MTLSHDEFCPCVTTGIYETCRCDYIDSIARRERRQMADEGWIPPMQHEAIVASARARAVLGLTDRIVLGILNSTHGEPCDCLECMSMVRAARIAEGISHDFTG